MDPPHHVAPGPAPPDSVAEVMEDTGGSACPPGSCFHVCRGVEPGAVGRHQCLLWTVMLNAPGGSWCLPRQLLQHECPRCPELPPFGLFGDLEQHMRKQHELFCCKLCLKHLKVRPTPTAPA